jgi:hypothetical protein
MWLLSLVGQVTATVLLFLCVLSAGASLGQPYQAEHCDGSQDCNQVERRDTLFNSPGIKRQTKEVLGKYKIEQRNIVLNTCGIERPTKEVYEKHKDGDTQWLQGHFNRFQKLRKGRDLEDDETTFPAWMAKLLAPNHPPSSMFCDGLNSCSVSVP